MKLIRTSLLLILALSAALIVASCRKCSQCTIKIKSSGAVDTVLPESCGSNKDIDSYESKAQFAFPDSVYKVNCVAYDGKQ
jgi:hypothetical protein